MDSLLATLLLLEIPLLETATTVATSAVEPTGKVGDVHSSQVLFVPWQRGHFSSSECEAPPTEIRVPNR